MKVKWERSPNEEIGVLTREGKKLRYYPDGKLKVSVPYEFFPSQKSKVKK